MNMCKFIIFLLIFFNSFNASYLLYMKNCTGPVQYDTKYCEENKAGFLEYTLSLVLEGKLKCKRFFSFNFIL